MEKVVSANQIKKNIYDFIEDTAINHIPILITSKGNNAVLISEEDWNAIQETIYLNSIPGMADSIIKAMKSPDNEFSETIEW